MAQFKITINNWEHVVNVNDQTPLLWVIRDTIGLTGTKYGCGIGQCGACTVHIDGIAVRSCRIPISSLKNKKITTIEGLSQRGDHPAQQAWIEESVPQCGYCQGGQVMTAAALLSTNKNPSETDIETAMKGNICRCGTYLRIRKAIQRAATILKEGNIKS
jgi:isoquinoline 1-oxidoreductase subunit alpha